MKMIEISIQEIAGCWMCVKDSWTSTNGWIEMDQYKKYPILWGLHQKKWPNPFIAS